MQGLNQEFIFKKRPQKNHSYRHILLLMYCYYYILT